MNRIIN